MREMTAVRIINFFDMPDTIPGVWVEQLQQSGERTGVALGGVTVKSGLTWYGASFPPYPVTTDSRWSDEFGLEIGLRFVGLRGGARHRVSAFCGYQAEGWELFQGLRCPKIKQKLEFRGRSNWGPFSIQSKGTGIVLGW